MNRITIIGNLTKAPEGGKTASGVTYCRICVAVNREYKDAEGNRAADYFPIVAWRALAENIFKYCEKGNKVAVSGRLETRTYIKDGQNRTAFDIIADAVEFLTPKAKADAPEEIPLPEPPEPKDNAPELEQLEIINESLPF